MLLDLSHYRNIINLCDIKTIFFLFFFTDEPLRLSSDIIQEAGMIIIQKYGVDGYVCNMNWQDASASVVCKQLGYEGGVSLHYERKESGPLFVSSSLDCVGNETSLDQCNVTDEMCLSDFTISSVAGAFCYNSHGKEKCIFSISLKDNTCQVKTSNLGRYSTSR